MTGWGGSSSWSSCKGVVRDGTEPMVFMKVVVFFGQSAYMDSVIEKKTL